MGHPYNITIASGVRMGKNYNVHKGVIIGRAKVEIRRCSYDGESIFFDINSTVLSDIYIGNDILIASNISLNFNVHDYSIVIENPRIIHYKENATEGYNNFKIKGV